MNPELDDKDWRRIAGRREMLPAWLALTVALASTLVFWLLARSYDDRMLEAELRVQSENFIHEVSQAMATYESVLLAGRGLFTTIDEVSPAQWRSFVDSLELEKRHSGALGVGFAAMVAPDEVSRHEAKYREIFGAGYAIQPAGERQQYSAIVFLEPENWRNRRAIGYDMFSDPVRRTAMERARDTRAIAATAKVKLVQETETDVQAGLLLYLPVFDPPATQQSAGAMTLRGFIYIPIRMGDFVGSVAGAQVSRYSKVMRFEIFDGLDAAPEALLYDSGSAAADASGPPISHSTTYLQNGRNWSMRFSALPGFDSRPATTPTIVLASGLALSLLLWAIAALLVQRQIQEVNARRQTALLTRELSHRVKNTLAIVQSIANRSLADNRSVPEARKVFGQRLQALARAHTLLVNSDWKGADLTELVRSELAAFGARAEISGPQVRLRPQIAHTFSLVLHELSTNAVKHGALSTAAGRVHVSWSRERREAVPTFQFVWRESGGPPVTVPETTGFGMLLLKQAVAHGAAAQPQIEYLPGGLKYTMELPFDAVGRLDDPEDLDSAGGVS